MNRRLLITIVMGLISMQAISQSPVYTHFTRYKVEDGLPQNFVSGIQQDQDGFLWIATRDGLTRYDGREFRVFRQDRNDSTSLRSNIITELYLDAQNLLWVFYINQQFDCFNPAQLKICTPDSFQKVSDLMKSFKVNRFIRDRKGKFWLKTNYEGIISYDPATSQVANYNIAYRNLQSNNNIGLTEQPDGSIYAVTDKGIELIQSPGKTKPVFYPFDPLIKFKFIPGANYKVASLPDGRIAISETDRIILFNTSEKSFTSIDLPHQTPTVAGIIHHLYVANDGLLYMEAGGNIYRLEKNNKLTWLWQSSSANPYGNDAKSFLVDRSGVMWFGTNAAGLYKVDLKTIPFYNLAYRKNFVVDHLETLPGITGGKLPTQYTSGIWAYGFRYCYDATGTLYFTYSESQMAREAGNVYSYKNNKLSVLPGNSDEYPVRGLSITPSGILVAVDRKGTLRTWDRDHSNPVYTNLSLTLNPETGDVVDMEAYDDMIWMATEKNGLYLIRDQMVSRHFKKGEGKNDLPGNQLTDMCKDPFDPNILWIGTLGQGLVRWNKMKGTEEVYTTDQGLANNTIYSIIPDSTHHLWISSNKGISRFNTITGKVYHFDTRDGIIGNEFNRFHHFRYPDGRFAFGGFEGSSTFNPDLFSADSFSTPVAFTRLYINNNESGIEGINGLPQLNLPYNENFLGIEFSGLQFNQPGRLQYRYMLKGYDKEWIYAGSRNLATYTRLPPGRYSFRVNSSNTGGDWSPVIKELSIRIRPPLWATWWAYMIYVLIALALIRVYWQYRVKEIRLQNEIALEHSKARHMKEVDEIKNRFFANITHEFRTPLTLILTPLEKLEKNDQLPSVHRQTIINAHRNAEKLLSLINQLLDISKIESSQMKVNLSTGELDAFILSSVQSFAEQAKEKGIELGCLFEGVSGHYLFDKEKWEKILVNLLGNAIKFTSVNGKVSVEVKEKIIEHNTWIEMTVHDNGIGIPPDKLNWIFDRFYMVDDSGTRVHEGTGIGLSLVKELTELLRGSVSVLSSAEEGTRFIIKLPVNKTSGQFDVPPKNPLILGSTENTENFNLDPLLLVVEDNEELRSFMVQGLSSRWRTLQASDGETAWDILLKELPEIVITDVMMTGISGFDLCKKAKHDKRTAHISFIMLTAKAAHSSRMEGLKAGADEYLTKPFHFDELELRVNNLAKQQARWREFLQDQLLPASPTPRLPHVNDIFLQHLYQFLDERLDEPGLDVEKLANAMSMSRRTMNRKLKTLLDISSNELIRRYRLQKAAILLASGQTVAQTAYSVGFETPSYFTQCFKEQYGQTPSEFAAQKTA